MTFGTILNTLLIKPIQLLFEVIYMVANKMIDNPGLSIIVLSLVMNLLVLPLYKRADAMQEEERDMEMRMRKGVSHIKKTFRGEERMMMLQTYYRQNGYKPTYVLRGAMSLFLEIPFFIAAYQFLSHLELLNGVCFGPIADLGKPDGMLVIAGTTIHILPIIMTAINLVSSVIFTKGSSVKSKVQLYAMAVFFLVFLYSSPAGLVFYWTLNNLFSLVKTLVGLMNKRSDTKLDVSGSVGNKRIFLAGGIFSAILIGILIPSAVIKASPQEFIDINYFHNPLWYIVSSACLAFGVFVIWLGVFYWLAKPSIQALFDKLIWIFSGIAVVCYMFFGKNLGILTAALKYENGLDFTWKAHVFNGIVLLAVAFILYFIVKRFEKKVFNILVMGVLALGSMSIANVAVINSSVNVIKEQMKASHSEIPNFTLSKEGKNVIVLMLDRAVGEYVPYLFNEKPELKEKFSGFTYYSNVVSFGNCTNIASPALFGGYEYTPHEINKRSEESLALKHNESLKVMPVLFDENGYEVTVCDPTYANYEWIPDLSIYDEYPGIQSYITRGKFTDIAVKERVIQNNKRNFFCYGVIKALPLWFQERLYDNGNYYQSNNMTEEENLYLGQTRSDTKIASGIGPKFMESYNVLVNLPRITEVTNDNKDTFLLMTNDTPHDPMLLQEPEYIPAQKVDNTDYENKNQERFTLDGHTLKMETDFQIIHYQTNMAVMLQMAKWFDYMRENDVYDNTRIILVADHGGRLEHSDRLRLPDGSDGATHFPLLMVKDFDRDGFTTSEEFMTNGDVPTLAMGDIIENPVNPSTGKKIDSSGKTGQIQYLNGSVEWDINKNNGNTFLPATWYSVHDNIWDKNNWKIAAEEAVLPVEE